jgi:hypothetical protein
MGNPNCVAYVNGASSTLHDSNGRSTVSRTAEFCRGRGFSSNTRRKLRHSNCSICLLQVPPPSSSCSFPVVDIFTFPGLIFLEPAQLSSNARPELVGVLLWSVGLYFGLSQKVRWGEALRVALAGALPLSDEMAEAVATSLHTLPFLFAGFGVDSLLKYSAGGNSSWAVATGFGWATYGGLYELARSNVRSKSLDPSEETEFTLFSEFAVRRLQRDGRCHLQGIRAALQQDDKARRLGRINDEQLRRFIRTWAPSASRSRNGFYRNLSIRTSDSLTSIF